eukprot:TRINITY_DN57600_c0_g1_i1.p1 TRINITY_DN57600_c0_g1~~TRINITY_DN57600_c0_g1_i1.p1  ORF type:complete len:589 (+),score=84.37 TRINITY_DN57600_c0_g1_i1:51-1817(+)
MEGDDHTERSVAGSDSRVHGASHGESSTWRQELEAIKKQIDGIAQSQANLQSGIDHVSGIVQHAFRVDTNSSGVDVLSDAHTGHVGRSNTNTWSLGSEKNRDVAANAPGPKQDAMVHQDSFGTPTCLVSKLSSSFKFNQEQREITRVKRIFEVTAEIGKSEAEERATYDGGIVSSWRRFCREHDAMTVLDSFMGLIIFVNAIVIGAALDWDNGGLGWVIANIAFSLLFLTELGIKLAHDGFRKHFGKISNRLDAILILLDTFQMFLDVCLPQTSEALDGVPTASLFRTVRLLRLVGVLRLFRAAFFKELQSMIYGMLGGLSTLGWSVVFFVVVLYIASLLCREAFGKHEAPYVYEYFNNVPRAMLTVCRCAFGDCSSQEGVPIFEHLHATYGGVYSFSFCAFTFFIVIGLFNVISAIFVDSTVRATGMIEAQKFRARLCDEHLWAKSVFTLLERLFHAADIHLAQGLAGSEEQVLTTEFTREDVDRMIKDDVAIAALDALDIDSDDHKHLSDILDPDNGGTIDVLEMVDGLDRLRGQPRRSDIVQIDMMVRALQSKTEEILHCVRAIMNMPIHRAHGGLDHHDEQIPI